MPFHIHHLRSFAFAELRAIPANLVLVCEACHHFVHSRENVDRELLPEGPDSAPPD
jgi:predicted HNH restriction endonuclease